MIIRDIENSFKPRMCLYNIPYDDGGYSGGYSAGKSSGYEMARKEYEQKLRDKEQEMMSRGFIGNTDNSTYNPIFVGDIPRQNNIPTGSKLCGYIEIDGTYHKCNSCEHEKNIRQIIWNNEYFRNRYFNTPASFFDNMPRGMLQEEYFAMKDLGFVKISSFKDAPTKMIAFSYNSLTYKQTDLIYPR